MLPVTVPCCQPYTEEQNVTAHRCLFVKHYAESHLHGFVLVTENPYFTSDDMCQQWPFTTL